MCSNVALPFCILSHNKWEFLFLCVIVRIIVSLWILVIFNRYVRESHCGLNGYLPSDKWYWAFFYMLLCDFFFGDFNSDLLPFFYLFVFLMLNLIAIIFWKQSFFPFMQILSLCLLVLYFYPLTSVLCWDTLNFNKDKHQFFFFVESCYWYCI